MGDVRIAYVREHQAIAAGVEQRIAAILGSERVVLSDITADASAADADQRVFVPIFATTSDTLMTLKDKAMAQIVAGRPVVPVLIIQNGATLPQDNDLLWHTAPLRVIGSLDTDAAVLLTLEGRLYAALGAPDGALPHYRKAQRAYIKADDKVGELLVTEMMAAAYTGTHELDRALVHYSQIVTEPLADPPQKLRAYRGIGGVYAMLRQPEDALEAFETAVALSESLGDQRGAAVVWMSMGRLYDEMDHGGKAVSYYKKALSLMDTVHDPVMEASLLTNLGAGYARQGKPMQALKQYERSITLLQATHNTDGEAITLNNMGRVYDQIGKPDKALAVYQRALPLYEKLNNLQGRAITCYNIGHLYYRQGRYADALGYIETCVDIERALDHPDLENDTRFLEQIQALMTR